MLRTWIELSRSRFNHTITAITSLSNVPLAIAVKSNAYGHGLLQYGHLAQDHPAIGMLCTAGIIEALTLRASGITKPILVMAYYDAPLADALKNNITLALYDSSQLIALYEAVKLTGIPASVHVKVDTGMTRLGIAPKELISFLKSIDQTCIKVTGMFTHLSDRDNYDQAFTHHQLDVFRQTLAILPDQIRHALTTHALSSGSLELHHLYPHTFIRCGLNSYGLWSSSVTRERMQKHSPLFELKPVMTWKTKIIQIKRVSRGAFVGYNRTFQTERDSIIAILPIGYYDGYPRALSHHTKVYVKNILVPVIGIISMNLVAIDVTDIPSISYEDEVTLLGDQPGITADELASLAGTINYEFITRINPTIPRIIVD